MSIKKVDDYGNGAAFFGQVGELQQDPTIAEAMAVKQGFMLFIQNMLAAGIPAHAVYTGMLNALMQYIHICGAHETAVLDLQQVIVHLKDPTWLKAQGYSAPGSH